MSKFWATLFKPNELQDGTRRAAIETVIAAREELSAATHQLTATIQDVMRANDAVRIRKLNHAKTRPNQRR